MKVGYLGPKGTFSEQAVLNYIKNIEHTELIQYSTIYGALEAVDCGEAEECVVPLENSIEGTVNCTIDALIFKQSLFIKGEIIIPVEEDFLVRKEYAGEKITKILSHPQGLAQCAGFIRKYYPKSQIVSVNSTAEGAKIVSESTEVIASLSPRRAAEVYGLKSLYQSIQDDKSNQTRFVVVTRQKPLCNTLENKTSIVFTTQHKPGNLYRILDLLAIWDLNMTKIESRPMKNQLGAYVFFVDLEADNVEDLKEALKMIKRKTDFFKYLGSYPIL